MAERPDPREPAPDGYQWDAVPATGWRLVEGSKRCRGGAGYRRPACGRPAVAELLRDGGRWWAYCPEDMYGQWVEDGRVMRWSLGPSAGGEHG